MIEAAIALQDRDRARGGTLWTVRLLSDAARMPSVEAGVLAMIDIYNTFADPPIAEWLREEAGDARFAGARDGRGILVTQVEHDGGNPRDGWPSSIYAATTGLPSLHCSVELASDSPLTRGDRPTLLNAGLAFSIGSTEPWERQDALWRAIVARFATLGYRDETLEGSTRWLLYQTLQTLGGAALLARYGIDEAAASAEIAANQPTPEQRALIAQFLADEAAKRGQP